MRNQIVVALMLAVILIGCGAAKETKLTEKLFSARPLQYFAANNQDLKYNRIFLWKENTTADQVKTVLNNSEAIDDLEGVYIQLKSRVESLEFDLQALLKQLPEEQSQQWLAMTQTIWELSDDIPKKIKRLERKEKEKVEVIKRLEALKTEFNNVETVASRLAQELEAELAKPETEQDKSKIEKLKADLAVLTEQKNALESEMNSAQKKLNQTETAIAEAKNEIAELEKQLAQTLEQRKEQFPVLVEKENQIKVAKAKLEAYQAEATPKLTAYLGELIENVDEFTEIALVRLNLGVQPDSGGSPSVEIEGWEAQKGAGIRSFSSRKDQIRFIKYDPNGGLIEFDVVVDAETIYNFRIARTRYADPGQRVIYQGDIVLKRRGQKRFGVAKFINRNLN